MTSVAASFFASSSMPAPGGGGPIGQPANDAFGAMLKASPAAVAAPSAMPVDAGLQGAMIATLLASTADAAFAPPAAAIAPSTPGGAQPTGGSEPAPLVLSAPASVAAAPSEANPSRDVADVRSSPTLATKDQTLPAREYGLVRPMRPLPDAAPTQAAAPAAVFPAQTTQAAAKVPPRPAVEAVDQMPPPAVTPDVESAPPVVKADLPATTASAPLPVKALASTIAQTKPTQSQRAEAYLAEPALPDAPAPTAAAAPAIVTPPAPALGKKAETEPETIERRETETPEAPVAESAMLNPALLAAQPTVVAAAVQPERATPASEADERETVTSEQPASLEKPLSGFLTLDPASIPLPVQPPETVTQSTATSTAKQDSDGASAPSVRPAQLAPSADPPTPANDRGEAPASLRDEPALRAAAVPADRLPATPRDAAPLFTLPAAPAPAAAAPPTQPSAPTTITAQPGRMGQELGVTIAHHVASGGATGGGETITLRLNPVDMGQIDVKLSFDDGGTLRAVVSADNPAALEMLRRDSADLGRALADAGVRADSQTLRFDTRAGTGQSGGDGQPGDQHAPRQLEPRTGLTADAPEDITPIHRPLRTRGGVDMVA